MQTWIVSALSLCLLVNVVGAPALAAENRVSMTIEGADLQFFPEIAATLTDLTLRTPGDSIAPISLKCPMHEALTQQLPKLSADSSWSCTKTAAAWETLLQTNSVCQEIQDPIGYFSSLPIKPVEILKMNDLEEVLRVFAPVLVRMDEAAPLRKQAYFTQLGSILVKVRLDSLRDRLKARKASLLTINKNLLKSGSCLSGEAGVQSDAIVRFAAALNEVDQLSSQLSQVETTGLAQAAIDADKIRAQGRKRDLLPYPSMTDSERRFLSYVASSFLWRARGGGIFFEPAGTNHRRVAFTLMPMREIARLNGGDGAAELGTALWLGLFAPWGHIHDFGRLDGDKWTDYADMKVRGGKQVERVVSGLESGGYNSTAMKDAGDMMAHCYWYGWERMAKINMGMNMTTLPYSAISGVATNWGEFCTGATMGVALSEALLAGH